MAPLPDFSQMEQRVFAAIQGRIFIGKEEIKPDVRSLLRDQAKSLQTSQLWEIMNASITQEAANLALIQSKDFDAVQFAKALHHWGFFMRNVVHTLSKE